MFDFMFQFESGGINSTHVVNWSKVTRIEPWFLCAGANGTSRTATWVMYRGFMITNGTADDVELVLNEDGDKWQWIPNESSWIADIRYIKEASFNNSADWNLTTQFGEVDWAMRNYTYEGLSLNESIIKFNISINAVISDGWNFVHVPVILKFQMIHNITKNVWKYGVDIDWSTVKDFPCGGILSTGDNFSLIARDTVEFGYTPDVYSESTDIPILNFSTNAENDTAIFSIAGVEYGREYFTRNYLINGTEFHNTTRIYIENASYVEDNSSAPYQSQIFVIFDGFKYNQSLGFEFDPQVMTHCAPVPGDGGAIPWTGFFQMLGLLALITIVFSIKKIKKRNEPGVLKKGIL
jgi:hypothetical protein